MFSRRFDLRFVFLALLSALLWAGCAQQDLYEPPGSTFSRVGSLALPSQNEGVAVMGHYAFVAGGQAGLHAIDFTIPSRPVLVQTLNTLKYSESIEVVRTFVGYELMDIALVVEGTEGITSYNITDPEAVTSFNSGSTAVFGNRIFVDQPEDPEEPFVCFLAESWKGVRIFESIPAQPGILAYNGVFVGTNGYAEGIAVRDGFAYVADDEMGLAVLDVRILDLDAVELTGWADSPGEALDVVLSGDYAYVADGYEGLTIFRIDEGNTPVRVSTLDLEGRCRAVAVRDGLAVLAAQGAGVHFVNVSDPVHPEFLGRIITEYAMDLALSNEGFILVADRDEGLVIMQGPNEFRDQTPPATVHSLSVRGYGEGAVQLKWYSTGDDRMEGSATSQEIRMSDSPIIDEASWNAATALADVPEPAAPGTAMDLRVAGLNPVEKHFAIRCTDNAGLVSKLSNPVSTIPGEGILLINAGLDLQAGRTSDTFTYEVTFFHPDESTVHEVVIDGTAHIMSAIENNDGEILFRYQTQLAKGEHTYSFHFAVADQEVPEATTPTVIGPTVGSIVFVMGSSATTDTTDVAYEPGRNPDEGQHTVVFIDSLVAAVTEVTQSEWAALGLSDPSDFDGPDRPVDSLTWLQAVQYCNALSVDDGRTAAYDINGQQVSWNRSADGWRLPTEAEWEWLCRSGSASAFALGDLTGRVCNFDPVLDIMGWYCGSTFVGGPATSDVSQKTPNNNGLYDMHGNVWEWCWDWFGDYRVVDQDGDGVVLDPVGAGGGTQRVVRGGSWYGGSEDCRSANREARYPDTAENVVGLRVVRTIFTSK
jgi:sulfatase modifying factor 1